MKRTLLTILFATLMTQSAQALPGWNYTKVKNFLVNHETLNYAWIQPNLAHAGFRLTQPKTLLSVYYPREKGGIAEYAILLMTDGAFKDGCIPSSEAARYDACWQVDKGRLDGDRGSADIWFALNEIYSDEIAKDFEKSKFIYEAPILKHPYNDDSVTGQTLIEVGETFDNVVEGFERYYKGKLYSYHQGDGHMAIMTHKKANEWIARSEKAKQKLKVLYEHEKKHKPLFDS